MRLNKKNQRPYLFFSLKIIKLEWKSVDLEFGDGLYYKITNAINDRYTVTSLWALTFSLFIENHELAL